MRILRLYALAILLAASAALAAVTTTVSSVSYTGNGATTAFPVSFPFFSSGDLVVTSTPTGGSTTTLTLGVQYSVTGGGDSTGTVTLTSAPASGTAIVITRATSPTQPTALPTQGPFSPRALEQMGDRATVVLQEHATTLAAHSVSIAANTSAISGLQASVAGLGGASLSGITVQSIASVAALPSHAFTPNLTAGTIFEVRTDAAPTINNPTVGVVPSGTQVRVVFKQNGTGYYLPTWGANYHGLSTVIPRQGPNQQSEFVFNLNGDGTLNLTSCDCIDATRPISIADWGADASGVADSTTAVRNAVAWAVAHPPASGLSPTVYVPAGKYLVSGELMLRTTTGLNIIGDARGASQLIASDATVHGFVEYPTNTSMPTVAGPYALGTALDWTNAGWTDGVTPMGLQLTEWTPYANLNGLTQLGVRFRYKAVGAHAGGTIYNFVDTLQQLFGDNGTTESTVYFQLYSNGYSMGYNFKTTAGSSVGSSCATIPNDSAWHEYEFSWDGAHIKCFIDGVQTTGTVNLAGTLSMNQGVSTYVGTVRYGLLGVQTVQTPPAPGDFYGLQISKQAFHTAGFTTSGAAYTADSNTLVLMNLDQNTGNQLYIETPQAGVGKRTMAMLENAPSSGNTAYLHIENISMSGFNNAIWTTAAARSSFRHLQLVARHGLHLTNQGFSTSIEDVELLCGGIAAIAISQGAGDYTIENVKAFAGSGVWAQIYLDQVDNVRIKDAYLNTAPRVLVADTVFSLQGDGMYLSTESGGATPETLLDLHSTSARFSGGFWNTQGNNIHAVRLSGQNRISASQLYGYGNTSSTFFSFSGVGTPLSSFVTVSGYDNYTKTGDYPVTPLFPAPAVGGDRLLWTDNPNGSGTGTASGATATVTVTFPAAVQEFDNKYRVSLVPTTSTGTPASGSNRVLSIAKTTAGFVATLEAAPGVGNTQTFDWALTR